MNTNRRAAETQGRRGRFSPLRFCALCVSAAINRFKPGTSCGRISARRGVSLVELLIAMLILALVCIAWLEIIGIQSARKEARRREAVERLAGMMDAFMYVKKSSSIPAGYYECVTITNVESGVPVPEITFNKKEPKVYPLFSSDISPIGYSLQVVKKSDLPNTERFAGEWGSSSWLVGSLYNQSDVAPQGQKAFFSLPVSLGR